MKRYIAQGMMEKLVEVEAGGFAGGNGLGPGGYVGQL